MKYAPPFVEIMQKRVCFESVDLKGLISKIYYENPKQFKSNVIVTATNYRNLYDPYNALIPETGANERWISETVAWQKYIVRLKGIKFKPKSYKILSENSAVGQSHLKSWNFSCSLDGKNWDILQYMVNSNDLNGKSILKEYEVSSDKYYSFFKIEATGDSWFSYESNSPYHKMITIQQIDIIAKDVIRYRLTQPIKWNKTIRSVFRGS